MLLLIAVLAVLSAATLLFVRNRRQRHAFTPNRSNYLAEETHLRPLFAPDKAALDLEARQIAAAATVLKNKIDEDARRSELEKARRDWNAAPNGKTTVALLEVATNSKSADTFAETANEILRSFRDGRLGGVAENDLADLLESHYRLLPPSQRSSGAIFVMKEEIANLRASSRTKAG